MLVHDPARPPGCQRIVESFISSTHGLFCRERYSSVVETRQIALPVIVGGRHHPGITAVAQHVIESAVILKKEYRLSGQCGVHRRPIHSIGTVNVEVGDDGPTLLPHVSRRREVGLLNILQLTDQRLLGRAAGTGIPLDRALVDHDREGEAGMTLGLRHYKLCRLIDAVVRAVPVENDAIDTPTDHVRDLIVHLRGVGGTVTNVHVVRPTEPQHEVSVDLAGRARIKQGMYIHLAHIAGARIAIGLIGDTIRRTGIVRGLCG